MKRRNNKKNTFNRFKRSANNTRSIIYNYTNGTQTFGPGSLVQNFEATIDLAGTGPALYDIFSDLGTDWLFCCYKFKFVKILSITLICPPVNYINVPTTTTVVIRWDGFKNTNDVINYNNSDEIKYIKNLGMTRITYKPVNTTYFYSYIDTSTTPSISKQQAINYKEWLDATRVAQGLPAQLGFNWNGSINDVPSRFKVIVRAHMRGARDLDITSTRTMLNNALVKKLVDQQTNEAQARASEEKKVDNEDLNKADTAL